MIGKTLSHYRIAEQLGAGGMGVVYRARDERLDRDVALKVLPAGTLADEAARRRFRQEALALSRLNHPHIATVYDFDTQEGIDFLAMEYVGGATLAEKLARGALPEKEVARLGAQVAAALEEAHEQGVVHRDLKPANIALTAKGQAKVLDFGLAKLLQPVETAVTAESLSQTQAAAGTLPYMAPEQLRGETVDARTDVYALGAVLYEMATGQRAFPETQGPRLIDSILNFAPVAPSRLQPRLSAELERIILKSLDKEPGRRYQSAKELQVDLERLGAPVPVAAVSRRRELPRRWPLLLVAGLAGVVLLALLGGAAVLWWRTRAPGRAGAARIDSLAVLPLANLSGDPEQDYFADGMTEALITDLAQIGSLKVISRTSVMRYKGTQKPLPEIARELNVDAVIEGSVQRVGGRVKITAQLIEAASDRHLWAQSYERDLSDVLALQDEVARAIAQQVQAKLTPQEQARLIGARPVNPEAFEAYLKGRYHFEKYTEAGTKRARAYFQQAIDLDPNYAVAYAALADTYVFGPVGLPSKEAVPKATAAAKKALEIDDTLGEAHAALAQIRFLGDWDFVGAEREFKRALELNPGYTEAHHMFSHYLMAMGRAEESLAESKRGWELDPLSLAMNLHLGWTYLTTRQYDLAIQQYRKTLELDPNYPQAHLQLAEAYDWQRRDALAFAEYQKWDSLSGRKQEEIAALGDAYRKAGMRGYWQKRLALAQERAKRSYVPPYDFAQLYARLGQTDQAIAWLEKAYQQHEGNLVYLKYNQEFDPLRADPRFQALVRRVGLPP